MTKEKCCGTCKWWQSDTPNTYKLCRYPIPIWLHNRVTSGASERLADYVPEFWGSDCRTYEEVPRDL